MSKERSEATLAGFSDLRVDASSAFSVRSSAFCAASAPKVPSSATDFLSVMRLFSASSANSSVLPPRSLHIDSAMPRSCTASLPFPAFSAYIVKFGRA